MKTKDWGPVLVLLIVLLAAGLLFRTEIDRGVETQAAVAAERSKAAFEDGRYCAKCRVPANANPMMRDMDLASSWLHGWIAGVDEMKKSEAVR